MALSTARALARPHGFPLQELPADLVALVIKKSSVRAIVKLSETNRFFRQRCLDVGKLLLEELWKLAAPLSWSARSHGVDAIHTLALFTGRRPKVPAVFFIFGSRPSKMKTPLSTLTYTQWNACTSYSVTSSRRSPLVSSYGSCHDTAIVGERTAGFKSSSFATKFDHF